MLAYLEHLRTFPMHSSKDLFLVKSCSKIVQILFLFFKIKGVREEELDSLDRLGPVSPEVAKYIQQLQSKLLSTQKVSGPV